MIWILPVLLATILVLWWGSHQPWFPFKWMTLWQDSDVTVRVSGGSQYGRLMVNSSRVVGWGPDFEAFVTVLPGLMIGELANTNEDSKTRLLVQGVSVAYWWPVLLLAAANALVFVRRRRRRRVYPLAALTASAESLSHSRLGSADHDDDQ